MHSVYTIVPKEFLSRFEVSLGNESDRQPLSDLHWPHHQQIIGVV